MENILPVLLIVGGLIYKIYQNYQEEMEKAKKRQQTLRPTTSPAPQPERKSPTGHKTIQRPKPQPVASPPKMEKKPIFVEPPTQKSDNKYNEYNLPTEISKVREDKNKRIQEKKSKIEVVNTDQLTNKKEIDFDLRKAVIQSIILERPYKY